jgi:CRISPR-associated protein Cas2
VKTGTFVGRVSAMVRDKLWELVRAKSRAGGCLMVYNTNNEQGFLLKTYGDTARELIDFDGITLIRVPENKRIKK